MIIDDLIEEKKKEAEKLVKRMQNLDSMIARLQKDRAALAQQVAKHNGAMEVLNQLKAEKAEAEAKKGIPVSESSAAGETKIE
jgi:hypothetical protein